MVGIPGGILRTGGNSVSNSTLSHPLGGKAYTTCFHMRLNATVFTAQDQSKLKFPRSGTSPLSLVILAPAHLHSCVLLPVWKSRTGWAVLNSGLQAALLGTSFSPHTHFLLSLFISLSLSQRKIMTPFPPLLLDLSAVLI